MNDYRKFRTPYYLIDERRLLHNMQLIERVREASGAKFVLALKCFAAWPVFKLMRRYMDGTTSSSLYEARLGREKFGGETHAFSVAFSKDEIRAVRRYADKVIFNSLSQLDEHYAAVRHLPVGVRVNPGISYSHYDLADPARRFSRLGVVDRRALAKAAPRLSGLMFHFNCENDDYENFAAALDFIGQRYGALLKKMNWVSLGGGLAFTKDGYPLDKFSARLKEFSRVFDIQVYLEPGDAAISGSAELVSTVLDVVRNRKDIAIIDASTEAHMLDLLVYQFSPRLAEPGPGRHRCLIAGRSCLAGDVFGEYRLQRKLRPGDLVRIADAAGYTMVKKNWFNGLPMPSICIRRLDGRLVRARAFSYEDYLTAMG
ncbi:MAG: carboxynorspermidine decarboxylase [Kiritimatiellia bacterium]|jgi:carboxynorspermidine decarboxylase